MKSKKAEAYLDSKVEEVNDVVKSGTPKFVVRLRNAIYSVELAEQEAEKRVRKKAIEAFKRMCVFRDQRCKKNCKGCSSIKHFMQEMDRYEND